MNIFGKIATLRKNKGLAQKELAKELNVTQSALSAWECGRAQPDIYTLIKIANFFDISLDSLVGRKRNIANDNMSEYEADIIKTLKSLTSEGKITILNLIHCMSEHELYNIKFGDSENYKKPCSLIMLEKNHLTEKQDDLLYNYIKYLLENEDSTLSK